MLPLPSLFLLPFYLVSILIIYINTDYT